ncbi:MULTISPECIES: DUF2249 domain-containing protein [Bradyrhizobium]|nr:MULTISPECIES: DUF2249 domain-containing protein [Bradyrhizobium]
MTILAQLESGAEVWPVPAGLPSARLPPKTMAKRAAKTRIALSTAELSFRIFAIFRAHPHINNVLTHISRADWAQVERALNSILDPAAATGQLSPLAQNIIDLMCAERGITGKILKPCFHAALGKLLEPKRAERLIEHIEALYRDLERRAEQPAPASHELPKEPSMTEPNADERVINVADIDPKYRHAILFRLFEHLASDQSLQIVVDHDPRRLRLQLEAQHGSRCNWSYLERGPDFWRVRLRLLPPEGKEASR